MIAHPDVEMLRNAQRIAGNHWVITGTLPGKPLKRISLAV